MNAHTEIKADIVPLVKMREEFPINQISKLPKESKAQAEARKTDKNLIVWKCEICGGMHHKSAAHLDYVGHAALTDRLLDTDLLWTWEPVAWTPEGLPAFDRTGGLWIKLTVCGHTRLGYGAADGKSGGDAVKEVIGDALRNAAMRFGAALDLWHKGELHANEPSETSNETQSPAPKQEPRQRRAPPAVEQNTSTTKAPTVEEPKGGWGDWTRDFVAFIGRAKNTEVLDEVLEVETDRIKAVRGVDKAMFAAIRKADADRRDVLSGKILDDDVPY